MLAPEDSFPQLPPVPPTDDLGELVRQLNHTSSAREANPLEELFTDVTLQLEIATLGTASISRAAAFKILDGFWQRARVVDLCSHSPHPLPDQPGEDEVRNAVDERNSLQRLQRWLREVRAAGLVFVKPVARTEPEGQTTANELTDEPTHAVDFSWVRCAHGEFTFTVNQIPVVEALWGDWERDGLCLTDRFLLEKAGGASTELRYLFKGHPAWGTLIISGDRKGTSRLDLPRRTRKS